MIRSERMLLSLLHNRRYISFCQTPQRTLLRFFGSGNSVDRRRRRMDHSCVISTIRCCGDGAFERRRRRSLSTSQAAAATAPQYHNDDDDAGTEQVDNSSSSCGTLQERQQQQPQQQQQHHHLYQHTLQRVVHVSVGTTQRFTVPLTVADVHLRHEQLPFAYFFFNDGGNSNTTNTAAARGDSCGSGGSPPSSSSAEAAVAPTPPSPTLPSPTPPRLGAHELELALGDVLRQQFAVAGGRLLFLRRDDDDDDNNNDPSSSILSWHTTTRIECRPGDTVPLSFWTVDATLAEYCCAAAVADVTSTALTVPLVVPSADSYHDHHHHHNDWNNNSSSSNSCNNNNNHTYNALQRMGHGHQSGNNGAHPTLLPFFDPLFTSPSSSSVPIRGSNDDDHGENHDNNNNLLSVRVTYFSCGATCLGVTVNHCLADTASCVRLVQAWGHAMTRRSIQTKKKRNMAALQLLSPPNSDDDTAASSNDDNDDVVCCWNRSAAATTGMMTPETAELLGITSAAASSSLSALFAQDNTATDVSLFPTWMTVWFVAVLGTKHSGGSSSSSSGINTASDAVAQPLECKQWRRGSNETPSLLVVVNHEYVPLHFSRAVLTAMKAHGMSAVPAAPSFAVATTASASSTIIFRMWSVMASCASRVFSTTPPLPLPPQFVSTNDMVTAAGWLLKRSLSKREAWNIAVVVNLRGRCGVGSFCTNTIGNNDGDNTDVHQPKQQQQQQQQQLPQPQEQRRSGLFGNAITTFVARLGPTSTTATTTTPSSINIEDVRKGAQSIRQALITGLAEIPNRIALSRLGQPAPPPCTMDTFSTTSWGQLSPWTIQFGNETNNSSSSSASTVSAFHGQPAHPLPTGCTYSSVIHSNRFGGGMTYELFLPSSKASEAQRLHAQLCASYLVWYDENKTNEEG